MNLKKPLVIALAVLCLMTASAVASDDGRSARFQAEPGPPWVRIAAVNEIPVGDPSPASPIIVNSLDAVTLEGGDDTTPPEALAYLLQLVPINAPGAVLRDPVTVTGEPVITAYRGEQLPPGSYSLRAQAQDADANYSPMDEVALVVPSGTAAAEAAAVNSGVALLFALLAGAGLGAVVAIAWRNHQDDVQRATEAATRARWAYERHFNPFISGEPVRSPEMFFARHDLLHRIANGLHQNSIMVQGERRMGKTSLLYQLADLLRATDDPEWVFIPAFADLEGTPQGRFFHLLMESVSNSVRGNIPGGLPTLYMDTVSPLQYSDRDFAADLRIVLDALEPANSPRRTRIVLLIDEVDAINAYDPLVQQQLRRILVSELAENVGAVVAGSSISRAWEREESPWYNLFYEVTLEPFTDEQARQLLTEPVRGVYEWEPAALERVVALAEGRPYRLQQTAFAAVNQMLAARRLHITMEDVEAAEETIRKARE